MLLTGVRGSDIAKVSNATAEPYERRAGSYKLKETTGCVSPASLRCPWIRSCGF